MCARFFIRPDVTEILAFLAAEPDDDLDASTPRWNIAPTQEILGAYQEPLGPRRVGSFRWGFVPSWWKQPKIPTWVNARGEEASAKPAFRSAFRSRRMLVPASGFYEWQSEGRARLPYAIGMPDGDLFAMAGVWDTWHGRGEPVRSAAILTCTPCPAVAPLHDRMPVILPRDAWAPWLDPKTPAAEVEAMVRPWPGPLDVRRVGTGVNSVRNSDGAWFG